MTDDEQIREATSGAGPPALRPISWQSLRPALVRLLRRYSTVALDLIYTRRCEVCEVFLEADRRAMRRWLCDSCFQGLSQIDPPFCMVCGEPYDGAIAGSFRCANCSDLKLHFEFAIAGYKAEGQVRELVHRFKYQGAMYLRGLLGEMLARTLDDPRLHDQQGNWTLVPVPLFHARQRERQYNQAWELCRALSKSRGMKTLEAMVRNRATTPQASLSRHQRLENLRGAFSIKRSVLRKGSLKGRSVLLVDDVLTTGSTASECARILRKEAGVEKVVVITAARG